MLLERYDTLADYLVGTPLTPKSVCGTCAVCGVWMPILEDDHIVPKSVGGTDEWSNRQYICGSCHRIKTAKENSARMQGNRHTRGKVLEWNRHHREESKQQMGVSHTGLKQTQETIQKRTLTLMGNQRTKGKKGEWHWTAETRLKHEAALARRRAQRQAA